MPCSPGSEAGGQHDVPAQAEPAPEVPQAAPQQDAAATVEGSEVPPAIEQQAAAVPLPHEFAAPAGDGVPLDSATAPLPLTSSEAQQPQPPEQETVPAPEVEEAAGAPPLPPPAAEPAGEQPSFETGGPTGEAPAASVTGASMTAAAYTWLTQSCTRSSWLTLVLSAPSLIWAQSRPAVRRFRGRRQAREFVHVGPGRRRGARPTFTVK